MLSWGIMGKKVQLEKRYSKWGYIFVIPFVVIFLIFSFWPLASTFYYAFCYLKHAGNTDPQFLPTIGEPWYKNFAEIFASKSFRDALKNTFFFWSAETIPQWCLAFWLAALITDRRLRIKGRTLFRTAFFFPKLISQAWSGTLLGHLVSVCAMSVTAVMMNAMINGWGILEKDLEFFMSAQFFIIVISIFLQFGVVFIYAVAGITGIPVEIFEAAEMDGANRVQTFFRVTLPCMKPMLFFISVVTIVDGLGMVDVPSFFGSFDTLRRNLTLMMYLQNQAFMGSYAYDRAAAASVILLFIYGMIAGIVYFFLVRDKDEIKLRKKIKEERREAKRLRET